MRDGNRPDGTKVGGPIFKVVCTKCGTALIAFSDVLADTIDWKDESVTLPKKSKLRH
jgi:hypothetical protein